METPLEEGIHDTTKQGNTNNVYLASQQQKHSLSPA